MLLYSTSKNRLPEGGGKKREIIFPLPHTKKPMPISNLNGTEELKTRCKIILFYLNIQ